MQRIKVIVIDGDLRKIGCLTPECEGFLNLATGRLGGRKQCATCGKYTIVNFTDRAKRIKDV